MKWLWGIVTAAVAGLISGGLLLHFDDELRSAMPSGVAAHVEIGPWFPYPGSGVAKSEIGEFLYDSQRIADEDFPFARMVIRNESSRIVDGIRLELDGEYGKPDVAVLQDGVASTVKLYANQRGGGPRRVVISLPALSPGQKTIVYLYSYFGIKVPYTFKDMAVYSSVGRIPFDFKSYQTTDDSLAWLENIGPPVIFLVGLFVIALLAAVLAAHETYIKRLMKSEDLYLRERLRFDADPKRFSPEFQTPKLPPAGDKVGTE